MAAVEADADFGRFELVFDERHQLLGIGNRIRDHLEREADAERGGGGDERLEAAKRRVAAVADTYSAVPANTDTLTRALETQCGSCHHAQEPVPPNFLYGDAARVTAAIESCAPRIYVRLAMRGLPVSQRDRSPMPPDTLAGDHAMSDADNRALVELRAAVEAHLQKRQGARPSVDQLLEQGYEALPPCLPTAVTETLQ